ncbi:Low-density lipoprotein receptor-related protein 1 [Chionoecetes opilio]|uniref:Low-density lipoprotein receptor-related protein 1 n=1 Tax=Chionoecetes opilio TaxID=41210 RepID=A0A8J4YGJ3_CHIOP|nr:Low-density lipoprotein receptor-related protein 1 [Chionoecetes opilio]
MKTDGSFCFLLSLSFLLVPGTKESIIKGPFKKTFLDSIMKPLKKTFLDSNSLAVLETYIPEYRMSLKDTSRTLDIILEARRASICCKDVRAREEELSLDLRSALYTTIIALSRLQESSSEYRSNMEHRVNSCQDCDILPTHLPCNVTDWQCPSGGCVPYRGLCDGVDDCGDSSDEGTIACDTNPCRHDYLCDADHVCIPKSYQCDSQPDCSDGSDESDCASTTIKQCVEGQFRCEPAGKCVPDIWRCDGIKDCADGNDEASCKSATTPPVVIPPQPVTISASGNSTSDHLNQYHLNQYQLNQ